MSQSTRQKDLLDALVAAWEAHPELRLGLLLVNAVSPKEPAPEIFHMHDQVLLNRLRALAGLDKAISHVTPAWGNVFLDLGFPEDEAAELKSRSTAEIFEKLEKMKAAPQPRLREYALGETVWIAGAPPGQMTEGMVVHVFEMYGQKQYVIAVETPVDPVLFIRDAWTIADRPNISALGYRR